MQGGDLITSQLRLVRFLGQGGMGSVWLADHIPLCTQVVVKFCQGDVNARRSAVERFQREAALTAQAKGPHVVQVHDFGQTTDGVPFIALEHLQGEDLGKRLQRESRVSPGVFADWLEQIARGLTRAHRAGVVHRDIKPENLFLCAEPEGTLVKILDFGVAKGGADSANASASDTKTGALLGTAFYMSPEQVNAAKYVDARADLWSLAVVTYFALTGVRPFDAVALGPLVSNIRAAKFTPPCSVLASLPKALDVWMRKALAADPARRFQSAQEMASEFRVALGDPATASSLKDPHRRPSLHAPPPRQWQLMALASLGCSVVAFTAFGLWPREPATPQTRPPLAALTATSPLIVLPSELTATPSPMLSIAPPSAPRSTEQAPLSEASPKTSVSPVSAPPPRVAKEVSKQVRASTRTPALPLNSTPLRPLQRPEPAGQAFPDK